MDPRVVMWVAAREVTIRMSEKTRKRARVSASRRKEIAELEVSSAHVDTLHRLIGTPWWTWTDGDVKALEASVAFLRIHWLCNPSADTIWPRVDKLLQSRKEHAPHLALIVETVRACEAVETGDMNAEQKRKVASMIFVCWVRDKERTEQRIAEMKKIVESFGEKRTVEQKAEIDKTMAQCRELFYDTAAKGEVPIEEFRAMVRVMETALSVFKNRV